MAEPRCSPDGADESGADTDAWDAGDMGCGELIVLLRGRMLALPEGGVLRLVASDPGAVEDIPAWCRMTRHPLRSAAHPVYRIERRRS